MKLNDNGVEHYIFFAHDGMLPEYLFDETTVRGKAFYAPKAGYKSTLTIRTVSGKQFKITTLTRDQALNSARINGRLLITEATTVPHENGTVELLSLDNPVFTYVMYPSKSGWNTQTRTVQPVRVSCRTMPVSSRRLTIGLDTIRPPQVHEYFLQIHYTADVAMAFWNGEMVLDHFYHGRPWTIGLNRFEQQLKQEDMVFYFRPITSRAPFLDDLPPQAVPDFSAGDVCKIQNIKILPQYVTSVQVPQL